MWKGWFSSLDKMFSITVLCGKTEFCSHMVFVFHCRRERCGGGGWAKVTCNMHSLSPFLKLVNKSSRNRWASVCLCSHSAQHISSLQIFTPVCAHLYPCCSYIYTNAPLSGCSHPSWNLFNARFAIFVSSGSNGKERDSPYVPTTRSFLTVPSLAVIAFPACSHFYKCTIASARQLMCSSKRTFYQCATVSMFPARAGFY
jgi:hypothetical protein